MNYRINVKALTAALGATKHGPSKPSLEAVASWMRSCRVYYKPLADIASNIAAGLYLSYLLQCHRDQLRAGQLDNGCISASQLDISESLALGTKVQRNARDRLKKPVSSRSAVQAARLYGSTLKPSCCACVAAIKPLKKSARSTDLGVGATTAKASESRVVPTALPERPAASGRGLDLSGLGIGLQQLTLTLEGVTATRPLEPKRSRDLLLHFLEDGFPAPVGNRQVGKATGGSQKSLESAVKRNSDSDLRDFSPPSASPSTASEKCRFLHPWSSESAVSCNGHPGNLAETCKLDLPFPATYIQDVISITTTTSEVAQELEGSSSGVEFAPEEGEVGLQEEKPSLFSLSLCQHLTAKLLSASFADWLFLTSKNCWMNCKGKWRAAKRFAVQPDGCMESSRRRLRGNPWRWSMQPRLRKLAWIP